MLADSLVEILVCPKTKQRLIYFPRGEANQDESHAFLFAPQAGLRYRIDRGIPVLLVEEAEQLTDDAKTRILAAAIRLGLSVPT